MSRRFALVYIGEDNTPHLRLLTKDFLLANHSPLLLEKLLEDNILPEKILLTTFLVYTFMGDSRAVPMILSFTRETPAHAMFDTMTKAAAADMYVTYCEVAEEMIAARLRDRPR